MQSVGKNVWYNTLLKVDSENATVHVWTRIYCTYLTVTSCLALSVGIGLDYIGLRVIDRLTCKDVMCYLGHGLVDTWGCVHLYAALV